MEKWLPINEYEGIYEISNYGNVRSLDCVIIRINRSEKQAPSYTKKGRAVCITDNGHGYKIVSLSKQGRKNHYVHRLVASHFLNNDFNLLQVNHIDGIKSNNHYTNLEWISPSDNSNHAYRIGLQPSLGDKRNAIKVIDVNTLQIFDCIKSCADSYGIKYNLLKQALNRNTPYKNEIYKRLVKLDKWNKINSIATKQLSLFNRLDK